MESFITGTGQKLKVHEATEACFTEPCIIHNPSNHSMRHFPTYWRDDRKLMERMCPHGVGHPDPDDIAFKRRKYGDNVADAAAVHGCDGCCRSIDASNSS